MHAVEILVNGSKIGEIPASKYDAICKKVRREPKLYLVQSLNICTIIYRMLLKSLLLTPVVVFWLCVFFAQNYSLNFNEAIPSLLETISTAEGFVAAARICFGITFFGVAIYHSLNFKNLGFVNVFESAIGNEVRKIFNLPSSKILNIEEIVLGK